MENICLIRVPNLKPSEAFGRHFSGSLDSTIFLAQGS